MQHNLSGTFLEYRLLGKNLALVLAADCDLHVRLERQNPCLCNVFRAYGRTACLRHAEVDLLGSRCVTGVFVENEIGRAEMNRVFQFLWWRLVCTERPV